MTGRGDDGGLRALLRERLPRAQWTAVETRLMEAGVPDTEYCFPGGRQGWVELKAVRNGWKPVFQPAQPGWLWRRHRLGGRCWVAVRRIADEGPRRGESTDQLWLVPGQLALELARDGLRLMPPALVRTWEGGPGRWPWDEVESALIQ